MSRTLAVACSVAVFAAFLVGAPAAPAWATTSCSGGGSFTISSNIVTTGSSCKGTATIPRTVTQIGHSAFKNAADLTSVVFETDSSLQQIQTLAFQGSGLTSIVIPNRVTTIFSNAFEDAMSLTSVSFEADSSLTELKKAIFKGSGLRTIEIPNSVLHIRLEAFQDATTLTSVTFEAASLLQTIGDFAFLNVGLTSINVPATVTSIGQQAFRNVSGLTSVTFEGNAPTVGSNAFTNVASGATANVGFAATGFEPVVSGRWQGLVLVRAADPSAPVAAASGPVGPQLRCTPDGALTVGSPVTCTVSGGDPGIDILWRAAYNPVIVEQGVTLDANGSGEFSFVVPAAAIGEVITVELVEWLAPMSLGTADGPTPASVPAGEGPLPLWPVLLLALAGGLALRRRSGSGWPPLRVS